MEYLGKLISEHYELVNAQDHNPNLGMDYWGLENKGMDPEKYRDKLRYKREIHGFRDRQNWKLRREHNGRLAEYAAIEAEKAKQAAEKAGKAEKAEKEKARREEVEEE